MGPVLRQAVEHYPVIVLTGARQAGKSTLLRNEPPFSAWRYVNLDDFDLLDQAKHDPASLWAGADGVVLDEIQKATNVLDAIKIEVDSDHSGRRFVLSGSANLLLMKGVSESLAGRAVYHVLNPMTLGEMNESPPPGTLGMLLGGEFPPDGEATVALPDLIETMWKGFLPTLMRFDKPEVISGWWEGYVATYLERDLRRLSQVASLSDFRRVMNALALRCGNVLNQSEVARDIRMSQPTVHRYIRLLETTCLMSRLAAYAVNRTKRLVKSPKVMWMDPGLVAFLSGHFDPDSMRKSRQAGALFEAMVYLHLASLCQLMTPKPQLFHWRTVGGQEVDFVLEWGRQIVAIEVKLGSEPRYADARGLRAFSEEYPEVSACVLLHTGKALKRLDDKVVAMPWHVLLGL